jgi:hypothetical protein
MVFSAGDTYMTDADSMLGKRPAADQEEESVDRTRAMVLREESEVEGKSKKGRCEVVAEGKKEGTQNLEATSLGAAGQLTGTHGAPRQQQ